MAIDKVGLSERDETIGRLYALRAGLSVVAREKETADEIMSAAKESKERTVGAAKMRVEQAESSLLYEQNSLYDIPKKISDLKRNAKSAGLVSRIIVYVLVYTILISIALGGFYLFFVGMGQFVLHGIIYSPKQPLPGLWEPLIGWLDFEWFWLIIPAGFIACGGPTAALVMLIIKKNMFRCSLRDRKSARAEIEYLKNSVSAQEDAIESAKSRVAKEREQMAIEIKDADALFEQKKKKATEHAVAGLIMINALDDSFSDMIDMRDWENTDILIYALETRRAENMKEALQVVDGERRTERIVEAVNTAGQEICKSINTGLRRLQGEMTRCFGILGQLVVLQGDRIAGHIQSLGDDIAANNSYMAQLSSQQSMSNALLAKANENSATIAAEVNRLRTGAEYATARSLYGTR